MRLLLIAIILLGGCGKCPLDTQRENIACCVAQCEAQDYICKTYCQKYGYKEDCPNVA
jgi:hypothetical protein